MADIAVSGMAAATAYGRGTGALAEHVFAGKPGFSAVHRFDTSLHRAHVAALLPGATTLEAELAEVIDAACSDAGLSTADRAATPLLLAAEREDGRARLPRWGRTPEQTPAGLGATLAEECGLGRLVRAYTTACVSASTAVIDGAAMIASGRAERVVVAGGYLVTRDDFAMFNAGFALSDDGAVRPFSAGRRGLLLGDGVAAVVLERSARRSPRARLTGWGRAGDGYHVCQPHPEGHGMARAIRAALGRAGLEPEDLGYVNAHGTGTSYNDAAEAAALHRAFGLMADKIPVSSTKALHGHVLEASGLVELIVTILALTSGCLPVNAGFTGPDADCALDLVLDQPRQTTHRHALSLNAAFGGANTALVVSQP
ncbi:beta-ketoacyl-[acyl-carrier-protein] synthase family protein [Longispora albida]|uniref:beta-ketoacyl-[acyl-carrier-protein] synthase family protein n=1 Tax=Longispora albida TaxID=203523 RepID=UPI00035D3E81|nr:beta-ketoacyl synthase N-terminal-like domain-containing protein [Longispora albida]